MTHAAHAMLDRGRPLDQPGVDLLEAGGFVDRGKFLGRRIPVARLDRRDVAADTSSSSSASRIAARLPSPPISPANRPPGLSERTRSPAPPAPSRAPSAAPRWRRPRRTRHELACRRRPSARASTPFAARSADHFGRIVDPEHRRPRAPRSCCVSVPSPQPTSRICSPGCGSSRSSAAPPSSATNPPTAA